MNLPVIQRLFASPAALAPAIGQGEALAPRLWAAMRRYGARVAELGLLLAVVGATLVFTGHNIFHYPQYELDEGTYVGSAWAMITKHELFYYTYTYAHPPLGWLQIGVWSTLTGGFAAFGMAINSGRVFMLVLTALTTAILFRIVHVETGRISAAALAALLFATSPLAISLHREVYLDNIGTFWLLASILLLQTANGRFSRLVWSALAFGVAFLSKEVFAVMLPVMIFLVFTTSHPLQRRFSTVLWTMIAGAAMSFFVLLAILKDELLPPGTLWSSSKPHVSLVTTYTHQAGRGGGGLLDLHGDFWKNAHLWWINGPILISGGAVALALSLLLWRRSKLALSTVLLAGFFILFLGRGGIVIYYYVIPLLALLALALGFVVGHAENLLGRWRVLRPVVAPVVLSAALLVTGLNWTRNDLNFSVDDTTSQVAAAQWVVRNLPPSSAIVMDSYAWQDLRGPAFTHGHPFSDANYYWPLLSDAKLVATLFNNNWQSIDYLMISPNTLADARSNNLPLLQQALSRSDPVRTFSSGNWSQSIYRVRKLHKMRVAQDPILVRTWTGDKARFMKQGRVVVDRTTGASTSLGESEAMERAVYANDRATFDSVWHWADSTMTASGDHLLGSTWTPGAAKAAPTIDRRSTTEADEQAALSLLFASKQWGDPTYLKEARAILNDIWAKETIQVGGYRVAVAGDWARANRVVALSALDPAAYRIFAQADPTHDWMTLVDSTYHLLGQIRASSTLGGSKGLAPDAVALDAKSGAPKPAGVTPAGSDGFSVAGSRLPWNLALDYLWFQDDRAKEAIGGLHFFRDQLTAKTAFLADAYTLSGAAKGGHESIALDAGVIPSMLITNDPNLDAANKAFATKVLHNLTDTIGTAYWGTDARDYQTQTQAWMTTALMDGAVANIWAGDQVMHWDQSLTQKKQ